MSKLFNEVDIDGASFRYIAEDPTSQKVADSGIIAATRVAEEFDGADITPSFAAELDEVRRVSTSLFHDSLARYVLARVASHGTGSTALTEDVAASAYRGAAIAILDTALELLDGKAEKELLSKAFALQRRLSRVTSDSVQLTIIKKPDSHHTLKDCCQALAEHVLKPLMDTRHPLVEALSRTLAVYLELSQGDTFLS